MEKLHKGILWGLMLVLPFWLWAYSALATAPIQSGTDGGSGGATTRSQNFTQAVGTGNLMVFYASNTTDKTTSVSSVEWLGGGAACGTITESTESPYDGTTYRTWAYYATTTSNDCTGIKFTFDASINATVLFAEYEDMATSSVLDCDATGTGASTSLDSATCATSNADDTLVGAVFIESAGGGTLSAGANYTARVNSGTLRLLEDRDVSSTGSYATLGTYSSSQTFTAFLMAFKQADTTVATPTYNYGTGTYKNPGVTVTISDATESSTICYTVDGETPGAATPGTCDSDGHTVTYTVPVLISSTATTMKAIGTKAAMTNSAEASGTYTLRDNMTFHIATAADSGDDADTGLDTDHPWLSPNHTLLCGDVILAKASADYSAAQFSGGNDKWGEVTCIDSGSNPVSNVAWLKCETFGGCEITVDNANGMFIDKSYWGIQGWKITTTTGGGCFTVTPYGESATIHHFVFANNIASGCAANGFSIYNQSTTISVDYVAILGNIIYNGATTENECASGISIYTPIKSDSEEGTHIYIAGNFSFDNLAPYNCNGATTYDGNGIALDDFGGVQTGAAQYDQQVAVENNISVWNGGYGFGNTGNGTWSSPIYWRYNTAYGNLKADNLDNTSCGDVTMLDSFLTNVTHNIIETTAEHGCLTNERDRYGIFINTGDDTDVVETNWIYSASAQNTDAYDSGAFEFGTNTTGTAPAFANPVDPGAPDCSGKTNTLDCMATLIANYTPANDAAKHYGYRKPVPVRIYNKYWPTWLNGIDLPDGVVTRGSGSPAAGM